MPEKQSVNLDIVPSKRDSHRTHFLQRNLFCLTGYSKCTSSGIPESQPFLPDNYTTRQLLQTTRQLATLPWESAGHTAQTSNSDRSYLREAKTTLISFWRCKADRFPSYSVYSLSPPKTGCKNGVNKIAGAPSEGVGLGICGYVK